MLIKSILFDLDGTLVDSSPGIEYAVREATVAIAPHLERYVHGLHTLIGPPIREVLKKALQGIDSSTLQELELRFRSVYNNIGWQKSTLYDGVNETLSRLSQLDVKLFVVTNKPIVPTTKILNMLQLYAYFNEVVSLDSGVPPFGSKVDVANYPIIKYNLDRKTTLMVGDSEEDVRVADTCGIEFSAVSYGYGNIHIQPWIRKYYVLHRFSDLLEIYNFNSAINY